MLTRPLLIIARLRCDHQPHTRTPKKQTIIFNSIFLFLAERFVLRVAFALQQQHNKAGASLLTCILLLIPCFLSRTEDYSSLRTVVVRRRSLLAIRGHHTSTPPPPDPIRIASISPVSPNNKKSPRSIQKFLGASHYLLPDTNQSSATAAVV